MPIVLTPEVPDFDIVTSNNGRVWSPEVAALPGGGYVAIWADENPSGSGWAIMARAFDASGNPVSDNFQVGDASQNGQYSLDVTALSSDSFMIAYQRWEPAGDNSAYGIVARAFQTDGTPLTSEFLANTGTLNYQDSATITTLSNGNVLIGWTDASGSLDDNGFGARGAIFTADGQPVTGDFLLSTQLLGGQYVPTFTPLAGGGFAAAWIDNSFWYYGPGSDLDGFALFTRTFDANGQPTSPQIRVNETTAGDQSDQSIATLSTGGYVVTWTDNSGTTDGDGWAVMARLFGADGQPITGEFVVNQDAAGDQQSSSVTALDTGGFVVSWYDYGGAVLARVFDDAGVAQGGDIALNSLPGYEILPTIAGLDGGRLVAVWMDATDNPNFELHARTFTAGTNAAPHGADDSYAAVEGVQLNVDAAHGVLANDSDAENDPLSVTLGTTTAHGALTLNPDGSFSYTPVAGYIGDDSFTYLLSDGISTTAPITVTLTVGDDHIINGTPNDDFITPLSSTLPDGKVPTDADDTMYGYGGNDTLQGGLGNDTLYGGDGFDNLNGDAGNDKLYGEGGNDILAADYGFDEAYGGDGDDRLYVVVGRTDAILDGGDGTDTLDLDFQYVSSGVTFSAASIAADGTYAIPGGSTVTLQSIENFSLRGTQFDDVLTGSDGDDLLNGNGGSNTLYGGLGNDTFVEDPFEDDPHTSQFYGGDGYDTLYAYFYRATAGVNLDFSNGTGTFSSSLGTLEFHDLEAVSVQGSAFADTIVGGQSNDFLFGREGDDVITGGGQNDIIYGGYDPATDGFDTSVYSGNHADYTILVPGDGYTYITDNRPGSPDGIGEILYSIERLRFADGDYDWDAGSGTYLPAGGGGNHAPVGQADSYAVNEDGVLVVNAATGLLANDTDTDNDTLTVASYTQTAHGALTVNGNGSFTYAPAANYNGADSFTYTVSDGHVTSGPITVSLGVTPVNDLPTNFSLSISSVSEDTAQWTTLGTFRAQDVDGDTLTYSLIDADGGPFSLRGNRLISNAAFDYETRSGYDIKVGVSDGTATVQKIFHIDVLDVYEPPANLPPIDLAFSRTAVKENTPIGTSLGLLSAVDPEGGSLHWTLLDDANGTFRVVGNKIRITGNIDYETTHQISFTAQVEDNAGNTAHKTFTLDVIDLPEPAHFAGEIPLI